MVKCNHLLMSMFIMIFALSNCVQCGLRRVQKILATNSYITRFQTKLSRYRRADRPQLQILLSHVESQKPVKTVAAMYIQRLLPGSTFPISVISILLVFVMEHRWQEHSNFSPNNRFKLFSYWPIRDRDTSTLNEMSQNPSLVKKPLDQWGIGTHWGTF